MNISIVNKTSNDLIISIPNIPNDFVISSDMKKDIFCDAGVEMLSVKKEYIELSRKQKFFSYVVGAIIGTLLCLIYYSQIESLKNNVKFPVTFFKPNINSKENIILTLHDTSTMELCSAETDGVFWTSEMLKSEQTLRDERKEYYKYNITMFVVPFVSVFVLSVAAVVNFRTIEVLMIAAAVNVLLYIPLLVIVIKNHIFYKKVRNEINTDDGVE